MPSLNVDSANCGRLARLCRWVALCIAGSWGAGSIGATVHADEPSWAQWRGPLASGAAPETNPPIHWSETENVRWKTALPGLGHSTPIVWGDQIFLTTAIPVGEALPPRPSDAPGAHDNLPVTHRHQFAVVALDRRDGSIQWQKRVGEALPHDQGHVSGSLASSSGSASAALVGRELFLRGAKSLYCIAEK